MTYAIGTNSFYATLARSLASGGSETEVYLSTITTLTGETVATSDFTTFGRGIITVEPTSSGNMEFISFTGVDSANTRLTTCIRGLSAKSDTVVAANKKYHPVGSKVIISFGIHEQLDMMTYIASVVTGSVGVATNLVAGTSKLSVAASSPTNPIVVGDNDGRVPTQSENDAMVGDDTSIAVGTGNKYVTQTGLQKGAEVYVTSGGSANAYTATYSPAPTALVDGMEFAFKASFANTDTATLNPNGLGAKTIYKNFNVPLVANDIKSGQIVKVKYDGTNFQMISPTGNISVKFGGDGSDGALTITSGTTTIDLGSANVFVKNYSSISITGTGKLAFSNPASTGTHIFLKSQGAVTLTSSQTPMIDCSGLGANGGAGASGAVNNSQRNGSDGTDGFIGALIKTGSGGGALGVTSSAAGAVGALTKYTTYPSQYLFKYFGLLAVGAGGGGGSVGSGSVGNGTAGNGGRGGGSLVIECGGAWNFTTASGISVAGAAGGNGTLNSGSATASGGGGGGGGTCLVLYNSLTANSGTITVSGGTGGNNNSGSMGTTNYGGGGGGSLLNAGNGGTNSASASAKTGGDGGAGTSTVISNTEFM